MKHKPHKPARDKKQFSDVASAHAKARGERMTSLRREVLNMLLVQHSPIGAYQLRDKINKNRAKKIEPASIYRCLDFFVSIGMVVKLESQNAFVLCEHIGHHHQHVLMLCNDCGGASELHDEEAVRRLDKNAKAHGFIPAHHILEIHGTCRECR